LRTAAARTGLRVTILRIAAIYGPGRGIHARLRAGTYRVPGDGSNHVSRVHVDDLAAVALAAGRAQLGDGPGTVRLYTVADEAPTTAREHAEGVAAVLGLPPPPSMRIEDAPPTLRGDRRVSSARLQRELGFRFRHPTWREGLAQCLAEESLVGRSGP
jgi:nucleoside-diphosphate-sugar epimerase